MVPSRRLGSRLWALPWTLLGMITLLMSGHRVVTRQVEEAVGRLGLTIQTSLWKRQAMASGRVGRLAVELCYRDTQRPPSSSDGRWPERTGRVTVTITLPEPVPFGLAIRSIGLREQLRTVLSGVRADRLLPGLGSNLEAEAADPAAAVLLEDRQFLSLCRRVTGHIQAQLLLEGDTLQVVRTGSAGTDPSASLHQMLELADAVGALSRQAWVMLGEQLGLAVLDAVPHRLAGERDGVAVQIRQQRDRHTQAMRVVIEATIAPPLPSGTRLMRRAPAQPAGVSTHNPVLDAMLVMQTAAPEAARLRLAEPALAGPLLEVLCEHEGARVAPGAVQIISPVEEWAGLAARLAAAVELASALSRTPHTSG